MKKIILPIILILVLFATACTTEDKFALKEKCAKYLESEKDRKASAVFEGIFYSEKLNTCVSKWDFAYADYIEYYDVFTDENIHRVLYSISDLKTEEIKNYEKELKLLK